MQFSQIGQVSGHPSGVIQNVWVARDNYDQAQVMLSLNGVQDDLTSYVCPIDSWDNPNNAILVKLKRFEGFENLEFVV